MKSLRSTTILAVCAAALPVPVLAQRQAPATPEQRLERLERQVQQVQRQVFPRGRPADTAGFAEEPAATQSSVATLNQRLDALERQMADILRLSEENGQQLRTLTTDLQRAREEQQQRISTLEQRIADAAAASAGAPVETGPPPAARPSAAKPSTAKPASTAAIPSGGPVTPLVQGDPAEDAYSEAFRLWNAGQLRDAITSLRAFTFAYPGHRRVSFANNLIGRALLDQGQPREAAEALLANYRSNPKGERAADSLFYLGQALMQLGQPAQACKAYSELDAVYGPKVRAELRTQVDEAKARARCG